MSEAGPGADDEGEHCHLYRGVAPLCDTTETNMPQTGAERQAAWRERRHRRIAALEAAANEAREPEVARRVLAHHMAWALSVGGRTAFAEEMRLLNRALRDEGAAWRIAEIASR